MLAEHTVHLLKVCGWRGAMAHSWIPALWEAAVGGSLEPRS